MDNLDKKIAELKRELGEKDWRDKLPESKEAEWAKENDFKANLREETSSGKRLAGLGEGEIKLR